MKKLNSKVFAVAALGAVLAFLAARPALAADERAKKDIGGVPAMLGISTPSPSGELRQVRTTAEGYLLTVSTGSGSGSTTVSGTVTANQGTAGASPWPTSISQGGNTATVSGTGALKTDGSAVTQPVSAASLPLPSGAATSANQTTANSSLSSIDGKLPSTVAADRTTAASPSATRLSDGAAFYKATTPSDVQPVSDAGGSLTVDGTVAATQSGSWSVTTDPGSYATPSTSTGACASGSNSIALSPAATSKGSLFCNEGTDPVRVGDSGISAAVGARVMPDTCVSLDGSAPFRGTLYCRSTTGSAQNFSAYQALP